LTALSKFKLFLLKSAAQYSYKTESASSEQFAGVICFLCLWA